jgi:hypothetical protein
MPPGDVPRDVQVFGDSVRLRHVEHFDECATTGRWSGLYFDYLYRDLEPHLLAAMRGIEDRARRELHGARRLAALNALYDRQDQDVDRLVTLFISCAGSEPEGQLGFGHIGQGRMGIVDEVVFRRNVGRFAEAVWGEVAGVQEP